MLHCTAVSTQHRLCYADFKPPFLQAQETCLGELQPSTAARCTLQEPCIEWVSATSETCQGLTQEERDVLVHSAAIVSQSQFCNFAITPWEVPGVCNMMEAVQSKFFFFLDTLIMRTSWISCCQSFLACIKKTLMELN